MSDGETDANLPAASTGNATDPNEGAPPLETATSEEPAKALEAEAEAAAPPASGTPAKADDAVPDPVAEAIDFLTKPKAPSEPEKAGEDAKEPEAQPAAEDKDKAEKAPASENLDSDPYSGFSEEQRRALHGRSKERIEDLHRRWKEADQAAATGRSIEQALVQHKADTDLPYVSGDQLAGLTKAQAAVNRVHLARTQGQAPVAADLFVAQQFLSNLQAIGSDLGLSQPSAPSAIEPHKGDLPQELKDLVEIYGVPEADVRLLAAVKMLKTAQPSAPKQPQAAPAPQQPLPDMRLPVAPPVQQPDPVLVAYGRKTLAEFSKEGITQEKATEHLNKTLDPLLRKVMADEFPGTTKDEAQAVFQSLSAADRHRIVVQAHREWAKQQKPSSPVKPPPAPTNHRGLNGRGRGLANAPDLDASDDPVADAVRYLSR